MDKDPNIPWRIVGHATPPPPILRWRKSDLKATVPERKTPGAAGYDLAPIVDMLIAAGRTCRLPTGLSVAIPEGFVGLIKPRSSAYFKGLDLDGTIDADYRGEISLQIRNSTQESVAIMAGERVAQMVVVPIFTGHSEEVEALDSTVRGEGGFGSTGK